MTHQTLAELLALADAAAAVGENMTEAVKGGGGARLLPVGGCLATLVEYIEYGQQPQEYNGVAKDPAMEYQLAFALHTTGYCNEDGTPYIYRPYATALSRNDKANAFLSFKAMNWKGTKTHFAQLLGESFILQFEHKPNKDTAKPPKSFTDLKKALPPFDQLSRAPYPVPALDPSLFKLFVWTNPQIETFASFYQEGKYDDGNSKNSVQEKMLGALDFHGSPLHILLTEKQIPFTIPAPKAAAPKPVAPAGPGPAAPPMTMPMASPPPMAAAPAVAALPPAVAPVVAPPVPVTPSAGVVPSTVAGVAAPNVAAIAMPAMPGMP
jgi:hypothetical protein